MADGISGKLCVFREFAPLQWVAKMGTVATVATVATVRSQSGRIGEWERWGVGAVGSGEPEWEQCKWEQ